MKVHLRWLALIAVLVTLFFWKILFTKEFSMFLDYDNANQAYAWDQFAASEIQQGRLPLWDPYMQAGRSFVGDMNAGLFYPFKLPLYLWPLSDGLLKIRLLHIAVVFAHFLAAWFMFLLCRDLGLTRFASLLGGLCFSLGGFTGRVGWPNILDSAVWLPLIMLALMRALAAADVRRRVCWSAAAGLALGVAILAGSLHAPIMDTIAIVSATLYFSGRNWRRAALIIAVAGAVAFAAGAVQLLPSMEYSPLASRARYTALPSLPSLVKPPYDELFDFFVPHSFQSFAFGGVSAGALAFSPYFGILPLLLAIVGVWRNWDRPQVRYFAGLGVLAFVYTLGSYSLLHGLAYTFVPFLWMASAPGRFIYLTHFAGAILAAFGAESLLAGALPSSLLRTLKWTVIGAVAILMAPTLIGKLPGDEWAQFSFLMFAAAAGLLAWISRGNTGRAAQVLLIALILFDLHAFNWTILSRTDVRKQGRDDLASLLSMRGVADFLKSQPGLYRVHIDGDYAPNMGDLYGVQGIEGRAATMLLDFDSYWTIPKAADLLNVRYFVVRANALPAGATAIYQDQDWKVIENAQTRPRAWLVHQVATESTRDGVFARLKEASFDPRTLAIVMGPASASPAAENQISREAVTFDIYEPGHMEFSVHAETPAWLVLSEVNYPGWQVMLNGQRTETTRTDWILRGLAVPAGDSRVTLRYVPWSFRIGAVLTLVAFAGMLGVAVVIRRDNLGK